MFFMEFAILTPMSWCAFAADFFLLLGARIAGLIDALQVYG